MLSPYLSQQPIDDFGLGFSLMFSSIMVASTDSPLTIPGNAPRYKALIKSSGEVWVSLNAVAQLPIAGPFLQKNSEMVNAGYVVCREIVAGDVIHFISSGTPDVNVVLYALNTNS